MKKDGKTKHKKWSKKRKIITSVIAIILVGAIIATAVIISHKKSDTASYSFVRTTTLAKGTLDDSVSTSGTVASAKTSNVTTSLQYAVKTINVAVGDTVKKGDVICTLDTTDLEKQISTEKTNIATKKASAQTSYNNAKTAYNTAKTNLSNYASTLSSAKSTYQAAKKPYTTAKNAVKSKQSAYDKALSAYNKAAANYVKSPTDANAKKLYGGLSIGTYDISDSSSTQSANAGEQTQSTANTVSVTKDYSAYSSGALAKLVKAATAVQNAKSTANYASLESAYTTAKSAYDTAKQQNSQYKDAVTQAKTQLTQAKEELSSASSSDTLTDLQNQLSKCKLTAAQDGTVTALNATVGSTCKDTVATIKDFDKLKVNITVEEADINKIETGMSCYITTDASDDTLNGELTQIDPTSDDDGSFGATVTVTSTDTDLKIGMNATVEIIVSSTENVYQVPIDAVGTENNQSFVYRKTGGEGTDMTFEKVYVTTGNKNDYYIEIEGSDLNEGDVIRSSSDLSEGIETVDSSSDDKSGNSGGLFSSLFGNSRGGNDMGGTPPSGNGGGGMPSGNGSGGGSSSDSGSGNMPTPPSGDNQNG